MRHVFPSETVWGGMLTAFIEFDIDDGDLALLKMYADIFIDETLNGTEPALPRRGEA